MTNSLHKIAGRYNALFARIELALNDWFLGLAARLTFSSVTMFFFFSSANTKIGDGFAGLFQPTTGGYAQILPKRMEAVYFDETQLGFFDTLIVLLGTYAEFILPVLILIGFATRLSSLAMIGFIAVMTYVDITGHGVGEETIGTFFDRFQDAAIADQRLLWLFPLLYLVIKGAGMISVDGLFSRKINPPKMHA